MQPPPASARRCECRCGHAPLRPPPSPWTPADWQRGPASSGSAHWCWSSARSPATTTTVTRHTNTTHGGVSKQIRITHSPRADKRGSSEDTPPFKHSYRRNLAPRRMYGPTRTGSTLYTRTLPATVSFTGVLPPPPRLLTAAGPASVGTACQQRPCSVLAASSASRHHCRQGRPAVPPKPAAHPPPTATISAKVVPTFA